MAVALRTLRLTFLALAVPAVVSAQETGTVTGQVLKAGSHVPLPGANVDLLAQPGDRVAATATTNADGRFTMRQLPAGTYSLAVYRVGYAKRRIDGVRVDAGVPTTVNAELAALLAEVRTGSKMPEKRHDSANTTSVIGGDEMMAKPVLTPAQQLGSIAGVDAPQTSMIGNTVVARGFNNAFSGALLMLQDYRFAAVPSLRVNIPALMSSTSEDIERIEVVLGPAAALYGPNAASGVMHVITKSPFDSKGTMLTVDGGERSLIRVGARHANTIGRRVGFKLSGEVMRGDDWEYRDAAEPATFPATPATPASRVGKPNARDFGLERMGGEARVDVKVSDSALVVGSYGIAHVGNSLELTGANGTAQVRNWMMQHYQLRYSNRRFFAQAFGNLSNAGNDNAADTHGTFLLRTGQPIVDFSRLGALQVQHASDIGRKQTFLYGADYVFTNPRTDSTIHGRNEEDDNTTEVGGYVQSMTRLTPRWDLVTALRSDYNSRLEKAFVSPRAAVVFKPSLAHTLSATYNRAYSTPGSFQMFLDLLQGSLRPSTGLPYDVRALGVPTDGFTFRRDCVGGVGNLCMRSPFGFANGATGANEFTAAVGYQNALAVAINGGLQAAISAGIRQASPTTPQAQADQLAAVAVTRLRSLSPSSTQVGTDLRLFNPANTANPFGTSYSPDSVADIAPLEASFVNNFELGYKSDVGRRRITIDGWYQRRENFITAATNFTPTVFLGGAQTTGYIQPELQQAFQQALQAGGMSQAQAQGTAQALAAGLSPVIATNLARVPAGNVVPDSRLTTNGDFAFTYRNIDQTIDLFGADIAVDFEITPRLSLGGTYSWVSDVEFPEVRSGAYPLSLNAPDHKGSLTTRWNDQRKGYSAELRGRYTNAFFVNTGVYNAQVPVNTFVDASFSWQLPFGTARRTTWGVNATNILDNKRPSFAGVPDIGRLVVTRLHYSF
jgi:outer membrane receptor for ferrienterochelin and colicins